MELEGKHLFPLPGVRTTSMCESGATSCCVLVHSTPTPSLQLAVLRELSWLIGKNKDERWRALVAFESLVTFVSRPALLFLVHRLIM